MSTLKLRKKVNEYVNHADERILKVVYAMLREYDNSSAQSLLSSEQYEEIEKRWKKYKSGKSRIYTHEEVKSRLLKQ